MTDHRASEVIITTKQIAHRLGCSERTVKRLFAAGRLPAVKLGGKTSPLRIGEQDLRRLIGPREGR